MPADIPTKTALFFRISARPSSLPPRAERLGACLALGYEFGYRESIL
jgi:hypothetical protein